MSDRIHCLMKDWVESYEAIETLSVNNVVSNKDYDMLRTNLFEKIIDTVKEEVQDGKID